MKLSVQPTADVTIAISGHGYDLTLSGTTLTSNADLQQGNWGTAQTVTVKADQDDDGDQDARP